MRAGADAGGQHSRAASDGASRTGDNKSDFSVDTRDVFLWT
jgi:hypothetical protein